MSYIMSYRKIAVFNVVVFFILSICLLPQLFAGEFTVFDKTYVNSKDAPKTVTDNFDVFNPDTTWVLRATIDIPDNDVKNISSASVFLNGEEVIEPNQIKQKKVGVIEVAVSLNTANTIAVTLKSKTDGKLKVEIVGIDDAPPVITNLTPLDNSLLANAAPLISGKYSDSISGINTSSLVILVDSNNVAAQNITDSGFDYAPIASLNDGPHTLFVSVEDNAGNQAQATISFTTDTTPPLISNINPVDGTTTSNALPVISADYSDAISNIDTNSVKITLDGNDITAQSNVTIASVTFTPATDITEGQHTALFEIKDQAGNIAAAQTSFTIPSSTPTNNTPTIGAIGNRDVDLGNTLSFTVNASDPDNDDITLFVTPLPLPDNATFNCGTGLFKFTPDLAQEGISVHLTFIASDGSLTDSETITITVNNRPVNGITALQGQILDANDAQNGITTPVVGAVVKNIETGQATTTNSAGNFTLSGLTSGTQHFEYNGSTIAAPGGSVYGEYVGKKEIIANVNNIITRPVYLMRIDKTGEVQIDPDNTTVLNNTNLNITLTVPPNTVKDKNGNNYSGMLSISEVPAGFTPSSLPENLGPGMVISVQPMGLTFATPAPITFPNFDNLSPGSQVELWSLDHSKGEFFVAGMGQVSADGSVIDTIQGGIRETSWHFALPSEPNIPSDPKADPDYNQDNKDKGKEDPICANSGFGIATGNFFEDYTLPLYRSRGGQRGLKFVYNSTNAFPSPVITTQTDFNFNTPVPDAISTKLKVAGVDLSNETFNVGTPTLARQSSMFDASRLNTGLYGFSLEVKSNYLSSTRSNSIIDRVIVNNQINSPFGAGWTLSGIQQLYLDRPDGRALLTEGDGGSKIFSLRQVGTGNFSAPANFPVGSLPRDVAVGDFNGDNVPDIVAANNGFNTVSILIGDGTGNFSAPANFPVGLGPWAVAVGDFNGDNMLDIVTTNNNTTTVSILIGDGTGNFSAPANFPVAGSPWGVAVGDFNGDNMLDIVTANNSSGTVSILIGDGTGNFSAPANFLVGSSPRGVAVGDFNGDNVLDIVATNIISNTVSILIGDGTGNFSTPANFLVGSGTAAVAVGDFNGDNVLDIVAANSGSVSILIGDGTGNFSAPATFPGVGGPWGVAVEDFNGDNVLDIVATNFGLTTVSILIGDGTGNFSAPANFPVVGGPMGVAVGDFNGDNVLDIVTANSGANSGANTVSILLNGLSTVGAPRGDFSTLVQNPDNTFTRTMKGGTQVNFDANGLHTSTIDRNGNTTSYAYDANGLLTTITDPIGLVTTLNYRNGLLSDVTGPVSRTTTFQHDNNGNLTKIIDPDGSENIYTYDAKHLMTTETDPNGNTHTINYSFAGRFESMYFADGSSKQLSPSIEKGLVDLSSGVGDSVTNPAPNILASDINSNSIDGNGHLTTIKTDNFGSITESTNNCCLGRITNVERDEDGLPTKIINANGAITTNTYDKKGNLLTSTDKSIGATTTFTYDPTFNQVTSITDPSGNTTTINYDANGNPTEVVDALGNKSIQVFNAQGQLTNITDALGNTTTFTYDSKGNLATTTDPLRNTTSLTTDAAGNVISTTDANGNTTQFVYDTLNRLTRVTDANGNVTNNAYDVNGNLILVTDANGNTTSFTYDSMDRTVSITDPLGKSDTFGYDGNENLIVTTDRNGQVINFQYDSLNQLVKKTLPGNLVTDFVYDLVGNTTNISDPDSKLLFTYDGADRLTSVATTGSSNQPEVTINYTYDLNGNRKTMVDTTGTTNYTYDVLNRIKDITNPASQSVGFDYDALSRRIKTTLPNGVTTDFTYDSNSQLTSLDHKLGAATLSSFGYSYDNVGNRDSMSTTRTGVTVNNNLNYIYDNIYQLTQATRPLASQPDETFNYDPLGNRLRRDGQATNSTVGGANRLLDDTKFTYTYDDNGNLIQKVDKGTNATTDYTYDAENQLIHIDLPGGSVAQYRYDGLGRRIEKDVDGLVTRYVYDNEDIIVELDGNNIEVARYTHGFGIDEPLIMARGGQSLFYQADGLGSITDLTDTNGAVVQSYVYDSFGNIEQQVGAFVNPYTFTGREFDAESGLCYYRARYYDSSVGRFVNEDPIGLLGGLNLYAYVLGNPINNTDAFGLAGTSPIDLSLDPKTAVEILQRIISAGMRDISDLNSDLNRSRDELLRINEQIKTLSQQKKELCLISDSKEEFDKLLKKLLIEKDLIRNQINELQSKLKRANKSLQNSTDLLNKYRKDKI